MIDEREVREMLHRRADAAPTIVVDAPKAARRARRRLRTNGAMVVAAIAIAVATFTAVHAIRAAVPADHPTPNPESRVLRGNGEVLSFADRGLVAVTPETGGERVLVKNLDMVWAARWSADGRWVAYEMPAEGILHGPNDSPDPITVWVVGPSQKPREVASGFEPGGFGNSRSLNWMWSPTGAQLVTMYGSTFSTIDPRTGDTTNVGSIPEGVGDGDVTSSPSWSPDGTRFVVGARGGAIYSIDARTGSLSLLVRLPGKHLDSVDQIAWSPDGAHIAVMNDLEPGSGRLYLLNADGSGVRVVVDDFESGRVAWSPDGTRLVFADESGPRGQLRIWVAPIDGSPPAQIGSAPAASCESVDLLCDQEVTWSPDGARIGVRTYGDGLIVVSAIDADGSGHAVRIDELTYRSWGGGSYSWTSWGGR